MLAKDHDLLDNKYHNWFQIVQKK